MSAFLQVLNSLRLEQERSTQLEQDLHTTSSSLQQEQALTAEKDEQLRVLRECLQQVMMPKAQEEEDEKVVGEVEGQEEDQVEVKASMSSEEQLRKIEAMLDTTKVCVPREHHDKSVLNLDSYLFQVQVQLHQTEEERDTLSVKLQEKIEELERLNCMHFN